MSRIGSQAAARELSARERRRLPVEQRVAEAEPVEHHGRAAVQVGATETQPALEGRGVRVVGTGRAGREGVGRDAQRVVRRGHARTPGEVRRGGSRRVAGRAPAGAGTTVADGGDTVTVPVSGSRSPASNESKVDLPTPFGPTTASRAAGPIVAVTSARTVCGPCEKPTERSATSATDPLGMPTTLGGRAPLLRADCPSVDADGAALRGEEHRGQPGLVVVHPVHPEVDALERLAEPARGPCPGRRRSRPGRCRACGAVACGGRVQRGRRSSHWMKKGSAGSSSRSSTPICRQVSSTPSGRRRWPPRRPGRAASRPGRCRRPRRPRRASRRRPRCAP